MCTQHFVKTKSLGAKNESSHQHLKFSFQKPECWINLLFQRLIKSFQSWSAFFFFFFSFFVEISQCCEFHETSSTRAKGKLEKIVNFSPERQAYCNEVARFRQQVTSMSPEYKQDSEIFLLPYLTCNQTWLNPVVDDSKRANITKLEEK